jgi:hypothetical protein
MSFTVYDASVPMFAHALGNMQAWIDKAMAEGADETALLEARLAPDMRPLPAQFQMASDTAKNTVARLTGIEAPSMPDTEATLAELRDRCQRTIEFVQSLAPASFEGADDREVLMKFPNGMGYRFSGSAYLTGFALPNFFFHVSMAYALLRSQGVSLGKPDFLQHLGQPEKMAA